VSKCEQMLANVSKCEQNVGKRRDRVTFADKQNVIFLYN
jgi:hypothetical protein